MIEPPQREALVPKGGAKVLPSGKKKRKRDAFVFIGKLYYEERCLHGLNDPIYISFIPIIGGVLD